MSLILFTIVFIVVYISSFKNNFKKEELDKVTPVLTAVAIVLLLLGTLMSAMK